MKPDVACAPCLMHWIYERISASAGEEERFTLLRTLLGVLSQEFSADGNVGWISNRALDAVQHRVRAAAAQYDKLKMEINQAANALLPAARAFIQTAPSPRERFERACGLASAGNVSTLGAPSGALKFTEAEDILSGRGPLPTVMGDVHAAASQARRVLFLCDNAGEIGLDALLIEELKQMGAAVTLVVKEAPFFEDATPEDARYFGLDQLTDRIFTTKGVFLPDDVSAELRDAYTESDLIIAKGTFNFEALHDEPTGIPTIYLLKIKCDILREKTGVPLGTFIARLENVAAKE